MSVPLLSVIIPARDEARGIGATLDALSHWSDSEIVVAVDPDAMDCTDVTAASFPEVRVTRSARRGRGATLAAGAQSATGRHFLFLHADSFIAERTVQDGIHMLGGSTVAVSFRIRLDSPRRVFRVLEAGINLRSKLFGLPFGDQGLLISRNDYERVGGFRPYARCEDVDLVLRLKRFGRLAIAAGTCSTSTRRWDRDGILPVTAGNILTLTKFLMTGRNSAEGSLHEPQMVPHHRDSGL